MQMHVFPFRLEHATTASHGVDRQSRRYRRTTQCRWSGDPRRCVVRQDDEQVPVAGLIVIPARAAGEREHGFWLYQSDDENTNTANS